MQKSKPLLAAKKPQAKKDIKILGAVPTQEGVRFQFEDEILLSKKSVPSKEWFVSWEAIVNSLFKARKG
jgi:hypothetical protein